MDSYCGDGKRRVSIKAHTQCRRVSSRSGTRKNTQAKKTRPKRQKQTNRLGLKLGGRPKDPKNMTEDQLFKARAEKKISNTAFFKAMENKMETRQARRPGTFAKIMGKARARALRERDASQRTKSGKRVRNVMRPDRS